MPKKKGTEELPISNTPLFAANEKIAPINVADEIKNSFLDYSMSVIISRALPDARDGLKPSQRRILYAMHELSLYPPKKHFKCAKIAGDTSGNYHPHGEAVIYPTLVNMAQPWSMRDPLVDGQGNFGSVEGDPPAAMRYTEARLTHLGGSLMSDMDKDTVNWVPNYDERLMEPTVFPASFPNLLINGGTGIAVGMATNMPPHNLGEIIDGICAQIDNPDITLKGLMKHVKGPDFPTGCTVTGLKPVEDYFSTGKGSIKVKGRLGVEEMRGGKMQIVITEIPYNVNRATLVERTAELANEKILSEITAVRDESDENTRVVIELKRDAVPKVVINNLYKHTQLATSFSVNMLAIDHGKPKTLSLKDAINCYIEHRRDVVVRRTRYELEKAESRAETLEGYIIALSNLDKFIKIIRGSSNRDEAKVKLMAFDFTKTAVEKLGILIRDKARLSNGRYEFSEDQANAILELRLYQLTGLEIDKIRSEYKELVKKIKDLLDILAKEARVLKIIKDELATIKEKHATPRRTNLAPDEGEMSIEDLIANESVMITLTHNGLIKRTNTSAFKAQRRGGKGVIGMKTRKATTDKESSDFIEHLFPANTHDYLMFFTNTGRVYVERVHEIPDLGRASKGRSIANVLELKHGEKIADVIRVKAVYGENKEDLTWQQDQCIFFATRSGTVKKTALNDYANVRRGGIIAIKIVPGDNLIEARFTTGHDDVVLVTAGGQSIRFHEDGVRTMGRSAAGVRGIRLSKDDHVVALSIVNADATLLVAGENGIGKRTVFEDYRVQSRGGKGIKTMKITKKTGKVVGGLTVHDGDEIMLITVGGQMVRTSVKGIRQTGRNTQGVRLVNVDDKDRLQDIAPVVSAEKEETIEDE
ncbi:MAG: DNA gyrase subunit A [Verrucomicrobiota bacterium]|jgi:DNA gyrase subunit A|nr:DNA gyrase subunit A [Verrucomicrobiota bacterium]